MQNGMMGGQPQPQQMPPQGGMMQQPQQEQPQQKQEGGFNGVLEVGGQKVQVVDGVAEFQGKQYMVSDDGLIVMDKDQNLIGIIQNGKVSKPTEEMISRLKEQGILE